MVAASWIGPAVVAAAISAVITAIGWYASHLSHRRLEAARRIERITDVQTAIWAEIRSHRQRLRLFESNDVAERLEAETVAGRAFTPFVPREVRPFVFDAVVAEIHILPSEVIEPIVYYYVQLAALAQFAEDLRGERFQQIESQRKQEMFADYLAIGRHALQLADDALGAIEG